MKIMMIKSLLITLVIVFIINLPLSAQLDKKILYERKVESYTKMKSTSLTLCFFGGALTSMGIVLVSSAEWKKQGTNYTSSDLNAVSGVLCLFAGVPIVVTGIVLRSVGVKKVKEYQKTRWISIKY